MIVVGTELGRLIVFFLPEEIRPARGIPLRQSIDLIGERYSFLKRPDLTQDIERLDQEGYKFGHGEISVGGHDCVITEFIVFRDGLSVSALRTDFAEAFFDDFLSWSQEALGIGRFAEAPRRRYLSQIYVEFEKQVEDAFRQQEALFNVISRHLNTQTENHLPIYMKRLDFGFDPQEVAGFRPANLLLERRIGISHKSNRFISEAPLPTDQHIELLEEIERAFD